MKYYIFRNTLLSLLGLLCLIAHHTQAQEVRPSGLIFSVRVNFQSYGLPFFNLQDAFRNVGGAVGVEYVYNYSKPWHQRVNLGFQHHTEHEQLFYLNTQLVYRPLILNLLEPEVAVGVGRAISFSNSANPYYEFDDGSWIKSRQQSTGHWQLPVSIGLGYRIKRSEGLVLTPFLAYDFTFIVSYNNAFPMLPYSLISGGTRIRF